MTNRRIAAFLAQECMQGKPRISTILLKDLACAETEQWVRDALDEVRVIYHQCADLKQVLPANSQKYEFQRDAIVVSIAARLYGKLKGTNE